MSKTRRGNRLIEDLPEDASLLPQGARWARVERDILCSEEFKSLSAGARVVYVYLCLFINEETRSWSIRVKLLSEYSGYGQPHVRRCLAELESASLISRRHTWWLYPDGARQGANLYSLTTPESLRHVPGQLSLLGDDCELQPDSPPAPSNEDSASPCDELEEAPTEAPQTENASLATPAVPPAPDQTTSNPMPIEIVGPADPNCSGKYTPKEQPDLREPSPTPPRPPDPRPRKRGQGSRDSQIQAIATHFADRSAAWWEAATTGRPDALAEVLATLKALRRSGGSVSCRQRTLSDSIEAARALLGDLDEHATAAAALDQRRQDQQQIELDQLRCKHEQQYHEHSQRITAEQERRQTRTLELARQLEEAADTLATMDSPLPGVPSPRPTDARDLPAELRKAVFRFHGRFRTAREARQLADELRSSFPRTAAIEAAEALLRSAA